jgi:hypothetical protein
MGPFLILSPFAAFAALMLVAPATIALFAGALLAAITVGVDLWRGRSLKVLQIGAAILFAVLGCYIMLVDPRFGGGAVRSTLDAGLLAIVLIALAARLPFTIQYARENVDADTAARKEFVRANYLLTWVWVAALATMLAADLCAIYVPSLPLWTGIAAAFAARNGAMAFTQWYAARRRADAERATAQGKLA